MIGTNLKSRSYFSFFAVGFFLINGDFYYSIQTIEGVESSGNENFKTAVCVSGQLRTLTMTLDDPSYPHKWESMRRPGNPSEDLGGLTVAETIQSRFFPSLGNFDVFMSVGTRNGPREPRVDDLSACEPLRPNGTTGSLFCDIYEEFQLPVFYENPVWKHYYTQEHKLLQSLLQQLYGMYRCSVSIQHQEQILGFRYSYVVRLRPDVGFFETVLTQIWNFDFGTLHSPKVLMPWKDECCCGNEDWFNIGTRDVMIHFLNRFLYLQSLPQPFLMNEWNAEQYAIVILAEMNASLEENKRLPACLLKPTDRVRPGQP
jgi:hypothetical protein